LIIIFSNTRVFAKSSFSSFGSKSIATAPPTGIYERYYCLNDVAVALTANFLAGATQNWYGTNATGGTASTAAPIPSTTNIGSKTYYVSQTVGGEESTRVGIVVNVNKQLGLFCDKPKATLTSVEFDFSNVGQTSFNYSYTVSGGPPINGNWVSPSHFAITGLSPGQSVTFTLTAIGAPSCITPETDTCYTICTAAQNVTPTFIIPNSYCLNNVPPALPIFSDDVSPIKGTWSPSAINTSAMGTIVYTFTPDSILFPCAKTTTLSISVEPVEPDFTNFSICSGDPAPPLSNISPNGITGTWNPLLVDNMNSKSYLFTPDSGQPCAPTDKIIGVTVNPSNAILNLKWTVTEAFAKNQIVTVIDPVGANYMYQIDSGPFQTSPLFENVASGPHSITVKDINGCSELIDNNVLVIGYPKYFTPNGDNYNDIWNIPTLSDQLNARIYIFDRYGKLLKDISPKDPGWDGTYIGQPMPADDYWFTVDYVEQNIVKKYKSHFSLKR
jgi:gliding motility-associated-like protein